MPAIHVLHNQSIPIKHDHECRIGDLYANSMSTQNQVDEMIKLHEIR